MYLEQIEEKYMSDEKRGVSQPFAKNRFTVKCSHDKDSVLQSCVLFVEFDIIRKWMTLRTVNPVAYTEQFLELLRLITKKPTDFEISLIAGGGTEDIIQIYRFGKCLCETVNMELDYNSSLSVEPTMNFVIGSVDF